MTHYSNACDSEFEDSVLQAGDTFGYNGILYTVERRFDIPRLMSFTDIDNPTMYVVSSEYGYQVATFDGDWEGCHPACNSVEEALAYELMRMNEIYAHEQA